MKTWESVCDGREAAKFVVELPSNAELGVKAQEHASAGLQSDV